MGGEMNAVSLVFPHQLFERNPCLAKGRKVILVEETLFFNQFKFHRQKLVFHRASMKFYESYLHTKGFTVEYIDAQSSLADIRKLLPELHNQGIFEIYFTEVTDNWLEKRIKTSAETYSIHLMQYNSPLFINTQQEIKNYFSGKDSFSQTQFYIHERKKRAILIDPNGKPVGGKWSFDAENRKKFPANRQAPAIQFPPENQWIKEAKKYVETHFSENYGGLRSAFIYPVTFVESREWLHQFLENRFFDFGPFEDALVSKEHILHHSVLSPLLNSGLLTPAEVLDTTLAFALENDVPLNSLEGFVRQILGWREFIRAVYEMKGSEQRTRNLWGFNRRIPESFWEGTTGIDPLDNVIQKVLKTGYAHHIERLMVIGNFILLCEFHPDEGYRWFSELFIDAYDWVMVPNVYGMSQFADGGLMATKPYISGSNYLMKMSDFKNGDWQSVWDALFWRFMHIHRDFFLQNPRLGMLVRTFDKMNSEKKREYLKTAEEFLECI